MGRLKALLESIEEEQFSQEIKDWMDKAIPVIDGILQNFKGGGAYRVIDDKQIGGFGKLNFIAKMRAVAEVRKLYARAGLKVEYSFHNQMDENGWFTFS